MHLDSEPQEHARYDDALFRHHVPLQPTLPDRAVTRKAWTFEIVDVDLFNKPEDLAVMNPYNQVPVLVERDLILYESQHHQRVYRRALPASAADAGRSGHARAGAAVPVPLRAGVVHPRRRSIEKGTQKQLTKARAQIRDSLTQIAPVFIKQKYMLGDEFSMLDVAIAPLLWRLDYYGIQLPKQAAPIAKYAERLFSRPAFIDALTASEK